MLQKAQWKPQFSSRSVFILDTWIQWQIRKHIILPYYPDFNSTQQSIFYSDTFIKE